MLSRWTVTWWWREDPDADIKENTWLITKCKQKRGWAGIPKLTKEPDYDMDKPNTDMDDNGMKDSEDLALNMGKKKPKKKTWRLNTEGRWLVSEGSWEEKHRWREWSW